MFSSKKICLILACGARAFYSVCGRFGAGNRSLLFPLAVFYFFSCPISATASNPSSFEVASANLGNWTVSATTKIRWEYVMPGGKRAKDGVPFYAGSTCTARSAEISFAMRDDLGVDWLQMSLPQFSTPDGEIMPERSFDLYLDRQRFEIGYGRSNPVKMTGYDYPEIYQSSPGFRGYNAFRHAGDERWIRLTRLFDYLLDADSGHVGLIPLNLERRAPNNYYPDLNSSVMKLDIAGFKRAAHWCAATLRSPAAVTLPASDGTPE